MENFIKTLIYIHAFFGGLGLIAGIISILVRKGGKVHKLWGKIFSVGMITSSLLSLIVASFYYLHGFGRKQSTNVKGFD